MRYKYASVRAQTDFKMRNCLTDSGHEIEAEKNDESTITQHEIVCADTKNLVNTETTQNEFMIRRF